MKTIGVIFSFAGAVLLLAYGAYTWYDNNFPFGRMWETPGVFPHEEPILIQEAGIVPIAGGEAIYRAVPAEQIESPVDLDSPDMIAKGQIGYRNFCLPCHGPRFDGYGSVGQSFAPRPRDLRSEEVQSQTEGVMFKEISFGVEGKRQPALATTIGPDARWQIIAYVKSLGVRQ